MKRSVEAAFRTLQNDEEFLKEHPHVKEHIKNEEFKQLIDKLWPDEHRNISSAVHLHDFIKMIAINPKVMCQLLDEGEAYNELYNQHNQEDQSVTPQVTTHTDLENRTIIYRINNDHELGVVKGYDQIQIEPSQETYNRGYRVYKDHLSILTQIWSLNNDHNAFNPFEDYKIFLKEHIIKPKPLEVDNCRIIEETTTCRSLSSWSSFFFSYLISSQQNESKDPELQPGCHNTNP